MNENIIKDIDLLKGQIKTFGKLTKLINTKYGTNFITSQIKYQVDRLLKINFGNPQKDAYSFINLAKEEAAKNGFFQYKTNSSNQFDRAIYLSETMLLYSKYFLDIVIVDATYKRNRFNLPLINVIGINNHGQNIMLAFGLVSNETSEAYNWFFAELKNAWGNKKPSNFIIDDCAAMKQGIYSSFFFTL